VCPRTFNQDRPDFAPYGFTCELWQAAPMPRADRHNEIELNLLTRGSLTYLLGGQRVTLRQRRLGAFWAAIPHQIVGSEGRPEYYVVTLPLAWFLQCRLPTGLVDRLLRGQCLSEPEEARFAVDLALCQRWERDLAGRAFDPPAAALLELHARLLRLAESLPDAPEGCGPGVAVVGEGNLGHAERMAAFIARHYLEPLTVEQVAKAARLHPNYAMAVFKRTFHLTVLDYLTRYRISHAQRLLVTTDAKIVDVAQATGFQSLSRFYEAFEKLCGCAPGCYRRERRNPIKPP